MQQIVKRDRETRTQISGADKRNFSNQNQRKYDRKFK